MYKLWSYPKIVVVAVLLAIGLLVAKLLLRSMTGSTFFRGDEVEDTVLWFILLVVTFTLQRSWKARGNAKSEIEDEQ